MSGQLTLLTGQIAEWANRADWSPALVQSFVSMAEQKFNAELRVDRMITFIEGLIISRCAPLPDDWLAFVSDAGVRIENANGADGYLPIRFKPRDEFFNLRDAWAYGYYTIQGRQIFFGGTPDTVDGITFKLAYFQEVPVLSDTQDSWIYTKYPTLYLNASLMNAALHAVGEEQSAANFKQLTEDTIGKLNNQYNLSKASGSRVTRSRVRSFG